MSKVVAWMVGWPCKGTDIRAMYVAEKAGIALNRVILSPLSGDNSLKTEENLSN